MLLTIDCGNTNVVFAIFDDTEAKRGEWRASTDAGRTADEYAVWLTQLMALEGLVPKDITAAILASVVPAAVYPLRTLCQRYFETPPLVVGEPGVDLGLSVLMDRPEEGRRRPSGQRRGGAGAL